MDLLYYVNRKFLGFWKYRKKVSSKKGITPSTVHYIKNSLNNSDTIKVKFYDKEGSSLKVK